jgi:Uma2 family endonuclease
MKPLKRSLQWIKLGTDFEPEERRTMIVSTDRRMTLAEYLAYDDGTDARYELVDGALVEMGAESDINVNIAIFLIVMFGQHVHHLRIKRGTEIVLPSSTANTRYPDVMVLTPSGVAAVKGKPRSMITLDMPAPALVVEMVSDSQRNKASRDRDYVLKRAEYAARGIPEYWIIDPIAQVVMVLTLVGKVYQATEFQGDDLVISPGFPALGLTADEILTSGETEAVE